ncbi:MAG: hypothetical protein M1820_006680 [Bogoriella megaspora]|nr:MAG: hypothetical protein M1820_006680 [Bogoriella megaspora]
MAAQENGVEEESSETSPLLHQTASPPINSAAGVAPNGSTDATVTAAEDGGTIERQFTDEGRQKQYEGIPEIRKKMPYIMPALGIGVFMGAADQTLIVSSYGRIGSELNALSSTSWIATAYFLTLTSFQPLYGKMSDIFSRKSCLLFAYAIFGLGCLWCGLAPTMMHLILARAFAGIGGGGMTTVVSIFLSDAVPLRERGKWQGYVNIIFAVGGATGAPLGGFLVDSIGWRWAFLGQVPLCFIAFIAVYFVMRLPKKEDEHWKAKLKRIDFLGAVLLLAAVVLLLVGMDRGSNVSWKATITIVCLCVSIPLFAILVFVEMKIASEPFAPGHIIFERSLFACYLANFFSFCGWMATLFYVPLKFQAVDGYSPTQAGLRVIPAVIAAVSGSLFGGFYMSKTGKYYWITVLCYSVVIIGTLLVLLFSGIVMQSEVGIMCGLFISGFGNGIGVTTTLIGLIANASRNDQAIATACSYLFRSLGSTMGVSLSAAVANQVLRTQLTKKLRNGQDAAEIAERVRESLSYLDKLSPNVRELVRKCYDRSVQAAFGLQIGLVTGAFVSAWFIREKALSK